MFNSIISSTTGTMSGEQALICTLIALALGFAIAGMYMTEGKYSKSYLMTLVLLPALVQAVIILVNGNLGTSVAVMGAFSLVRFRSMPGNSKEIIGIFFAMVIGLATGMGFIMYAVVITLIVGVCFIALNRTKFGEAKQNIKVLKVTIPEDLDYTGIFDDIFEKYLNSNSLDSVKTTNMGSMYELQYQVSLKDEKEEKQLIDAIRCRNGNLKIVCSRPVTGKQEL